MRAILLAAMLVINYANRKYIASHPFPLNHDSAFIWTLLKETKLCIFTIHL